MKPRMVFTAAVMDLLHDGHINLLKRMRERATDGGFVLVVLHDSRSTFANKGKVPVEHIDKRTKNLLDTGLVDIVVHTFDREPIKEFQQVIRRWSESCELVFMRGDDWMDFPGRQVLVDNKVPIEIQPYTQGVSSTSIAEKMRAI